MKKIVIALCGLVLFSCASNKTQDNRTPAQTANLGTFGFKVDNTLDSAERCDDFIKAFADQSLENGSQIGIALKKYASNIAYVAGSVVYSEYQATHDLLANIKCIQFEHHLSSRSNKESADSGSFLLAVNHRVRVLGSVTKLMYKGSYKVKNGATQYNFKEIDMKSFLN